MWGMVITWIMFALGRQTKTARVQIKYSHPIPRIIGVTAITLFPYILIRNAHLSPRLFRHEMRHIEQVSDEGFLKFYIKYVWFFFTNLVRMRSWDAAYSAIPYEIEARTAEVPVYE